MNSYLKYTGGYIFLFCFFFFSLASSCTKDDPPFINPPSIDTSIHVTSLNIDPKEYLLLPGFSIPIKVSILPDSASNQHVSWSVSDTSIASISNTGIVTGIKTGTVNIIATSLDNNSAKAYASLTVLKQYDVHIVGKGSANSWTNCAVYWNNGTASTLPGGTYVGTRAYDIKFSGNDIYIAGNVANEWLWDIPVYWKNGDVHVLGQPYDQFNSFTRSLEIVNDKVYVAGYGFYNTECPSYCFGRFRASYYVDDGSVITKFPLYDSISSTSAYGITVKGNDVIIAGSVAKNNFYTWSNYWVNSQSQEPTLSAQNGFYEARAVQVHGNDLYFCGYGGCPDYGCKSTAYVWKNDADHSIALTDGRHEAQVNCMAFSGDILFLGGYEKNDAGFYVAKYWKLEGNKVSVFTVSDGTASCQVNAIAVSGNDIFLAGTSNNGQGEVKAKVWRSYLGLTNPITVDASEYYVAGGQEANGIAIR